MNSEQIKNEIEYGFSSLENIKKSVAIIGSSRTTPCDKYYQLTENIAYKVSELGFNIITGGGPGIMEAGNKGAFLQGGKSIGLNIELPFEQTHNAFISPKYQLNFEHFFTRKLILTKFSDAFVVMPGGFGTLDEFFEIITLMQTHKIKKSPIILVGTEFWSGILDWFKTQLLEKGLISKENLELFILADTSDEVIAHIQSFYAK